MKRNLSVGGQALIEGILMRSPDKYAIVVRKPDGTLFEKTEKIKDPKNSLWRLPFFRGIYALYESMKIGVGALNTSADLWMKEDEKEEEGFLKKKFGKTGEKIGSAITVLFSVVLGIGLFVFLPAFITSFLKKGVENRVLLSFIEGGIKMAFFFIYLLAIRQMKDVRRVFMYHGAEHKAVYNYESGEELTVENARKFSRLHPRCGTSFIFLVLVVSIFIYSFVSWTSLASRVLIKIVFLPIVAAIGYEVLKGSAKTSNPVVRFLVRPGLYMQNLTTVEPTDDQLEVALKALELSLDEDQ